MAGKSDNKNRQVVIKRTSQGGINPKTSAMNRSQKKSFKRYRGQGKQKFLKTIYAAKYSHVRKSAKQVDKL